MVKKIQIQFLLGVLICLFAISPVYGAETGYVHKKTISIWPTISSKSKYPSIRTNISCYDAFNGEKLDCDLSHRVIGLNEPYEGDTDEALDNNGGHVHDYDTHPLIYPYSILTKLGFNGEDLEEDDNLWVIGQTQNDYVYIVHPMPSASGKILTETIITAPENYVCASGCFSNTETKYETILDVGVYETKVINNLINYSWYTSVLELPLTGLPVPSDEDHYLKTGRTDTHPRNHYGTSDTIDKIQRIAKIYYDATDKERTLSINDISLKKGGLFDVDDEQIWHPPHKTHRTGTDADIDVDDLNCYYDTELRRAVEKVAGEGNSRPHLLCENDKHIPVSDNDKTGKYKHIDFD